LSKLLFWVKLELVEHWRQQKIKIRWNERKTIFNWNIKRGNIWMLWFNKSIDWTLGWDAVHFKLVYKSLEFRRKCISGSFDISFTKIVAQIKLTREHTLMNSQRFQSLILD
jgi:hypothetical protein